MATRVTITFLVDDEHNIPHRIKELVDEIERVEKQSELGLVLASFQFEQIPHE